MANLVSVHELRGSKTSFVSSLLVTKDVRFEFQISRITEISNDHNFVKKWIYKFLRSVE